MGATVGLMSKIIGYGNYETALTAERRYTPYSLGETPAPYDLGQPGAVEEIKTVLRELAKFGSDPLSQQPIAEDTWKYIDTSPEYLAAWDGPTADEFLLAVGRYRNLVGSPSEAVFASAAPVEHGGKLEIVGGPQPTVQGLELLAQAAHKVLLDTVQLDKYLAWRGGNLDSWFGGPPETLVLPTRRFGRQWDPRGWTFAWRDGPAAKADPSLLSKLDLIEGSIHSSWNYAQQMQNEQERMDRANILRVDRQQRHDLVKQLNAGAPPPQCSDAMVWSSSRGACVQRCPAPGERWDPAAGACAIVVGPGELPYATYDECVERHQQSGYSAEYADTQCALEFPDRGMTTTAALVGVAAVAGIGALWWWNKRRGGSLFPKGSAAWTMKAPQD